MSAEAKGRGGPPPVDEQAEGNSNSNSKSSQETPTSSSIPAHNSHQKQQQQDDVATGPRTKVEQHGFDIDQPWLRNQTLYQVLGHDAIVALTRAFYTRVYTSQLGSAGQKLDAEQTRTAHARFRALFNGIPQKDAEQNQYEFLIQRWGGPMLFSQRKGPPRLRARHHKFAIDSTSARIWVNTMHLAMQDRHITPQSNRNLYDALLQFFDHVAHFLRNEPDPDALVALDLANHEAATARRENAKHRGTDIMEQLMRDKQRNGKE